jgi:peptidoglycan pentaglycine glycine transferase (the first glycine)
MTNGGSTMKEQMIGGTNSDRVQARLNRTLASTGQAGSQVQLSWEPAAPEWDSFLAATPGGHYAQTSLWGQVKALRGWCPVRVVVSQGARIVAGAQLLLRPLPLVGAIGYIPKGPLVAGDDPCLAQLVFDAVQQLARAQRLQYLVVQPPHNGAAVVPHLVEGGFRPTALELAPTATLLLDLSKSLDDLLAQMKKNTRQNIRRSQRAGITVREGTEQDLPFFYRCLTATSQRQHFAAGRSSYEYYAQLWRVFHPHGYLKLFLAEYAGEAVSAKLVIPFGDVVLYWRRGWSGHPGSHKPNEALEWAVIQWAKAQGYRYCDVGGLNPQVARAVLQGAPLPAALQQTATSFKLGFGGQVSLFPAAYDYIANPVLRWGCRTMFPKLVPTSIGKMVRTRLRTH